MSRFSITIADLSAEQLVAVTEVVRGFGGGGDAGGQAPARPTTVAPSPRPSAPAGPATAPSPARPTAPAPGPRPPAPAPAPAPASDGNATPQTVLAAMQAYSKAGWKAQGVSAMLGKAGLTKITDANQEQLNWLQENFLAGTDPATIPDA